MPFLLSNFIRPFVSTAKVIEIQNEAGIKSFTFSVCNYQKSSVDNNKLLVFLQDNNREKQYTLDFINSSQALLAQISFKDAINTLKVNCIPQALTPPSPSQTPIAITYVQYKTLQQASNLLVLQWYDVTDSTDLLGFGGVTYRLLAKSTDDYEPSGIILSSKELITLSTLDDTIQRYEVADNKILALNNSKITYDNSSIRLTANNGSILTATGSTNIEVTNQSTAIVDNCLHINIGNNSNVNLVNATKVSISDIQQDLSGIGFNLLNVVINQSDSIGKVGKEIKNNPTDQTFQSYKETTDQELRFSTNNNNIEITLDNKILQSNGEFRIIYTGVGTDNTIEILDTDSNILQTLNDTLKDAWAVFRFNKSTGLFEFINLDFSSNISHTSYQVNVSSIGQTSFNLPIPATDPSKLEMLINGQDQLFGPDFTYTSPGLVTYQNRHYTLQIGDEVKFNIY